MKRRQFITLLGGAAAGWPLAARTAVSDPVIGFISAVAPGGPNAKRLVAFHLGLNEAGYADGKNLRVEYRWAEGQFHWLPALVADLVQRRVAAIVAMSDRVAVQAKAATKTIPIVFLSGTDPVRTGLVDSLNRPGASITGAIWFSEDLIPKQLELLHELLPRSTRLAALIDPTGRSAAHSVQGIEAAGRSIGVAVEIATAGSARDIDIAFAALARSQADGLAVGIGTFLNSRREQIIALAARHKIPAVFLHSEWAADGSLISYGNSIPDAFRRAGVYTARILRGERPSDLPVERPTRFELVINLKTAKGLGLTVPPTLLARADEVIE